MKLAFIINPISGRNRDPKAIEALIRRTCESKKIHCEFYKTEGPKHATEIATQLRNDKYNALVAIGGDGTINEVASGLLNCNLAMGIIPVGSGNGYARNLGMAQDCQTALLQLLNSQEILVDSAQINQRYFFGIAGIGFDAWIAHQFSLSKTRGPWPYFKITLKEFFSYKSKSYRFSCDGIDYQRDAFLLSIAKSTQYGNNAMIAPQAKLNDSLLHLCLLKKISFWKSLSVSYDLFHGCLDRNPNMEYIPFKNCQIFMDSNSPIHLDGEPDFLGKELNISVLPQSLKVLKPL